MMADETTPQTGNNQMILKVCNYIGVIAIVVTIAIAYSMYGLNKSGSHPFEMKLYFASGILVALALLFAFAIAVYVWGPSGANNESPGKTVFDACVKVIPPIITLILGAYFSAAPANDGQTKNNNENLSGVSSPKVPAAPASPPNVVQPASAPGTALGLKQGK